MVGNGRSSQSVKRFQRLGVGLSVSHHSMDKPEWAQSVTPPPSGVLWMNARKHEWFFQSQARARNRLTAMAAQ